VLLKRAWNLRIGLDPYQVWKFVFHKIGVAVCGIFQFGLLVNLLMIGRRSHEAPSAELLFEGAVRQRVKVHGEDGVHEGGWIMDSELLSIGCPRNNVLFSLLFGVAK